MNIVNKIEIMKMSGIIEVEEVGTYVKATLDFPNSLIGSSYTSHDYEKAIHGLYRRFKADLWAYVKNVQSS